MKHWWLNKYHEEAEDFPNELRKRGDKKVVIDEGDL